MQKITYHLSGLHCGGCVSRAQQALSPHADHVEVTLNPPLAILSNPKAELATLNQALSAVGNYVLSHDKPSFVGKLLSPFKTKSSK